MKQTSLRGHQVWQLTVPKDRPVVNVDGTVYARDMRGCIVRIGIVVRTGFYPTPDAERRLLCDRPEKDRHTFERARKILDWADALGRVAVAA